MDETENKFIDMEKLAQAIVADITELEKTTSTLELPTDLKQLDFASMLPSATANLLKAAGSRIKSDMEKVAQEQKARVEKMDQLIEESITARQQYMKRKLSEIEDVAGDRDAKIIKANLEKDVKKLDRHMEALKFVNARK